MFYKEIDIHFIEFFIKRKHKQRLHDYFNVSRPVASTWRNDKFPDSRLMEFIRREGHLSIIELFNILYKRD